MHYYLYILFFLCVTQSLEAREVINFNREWTYMQGDIQGAEQINFNDTHWEHIGLPHSFSIPYFMWKDFYTGYGWYRKVFTLNKKDLKKDIFLEFDGVFQEAEIYINGQMAGQHQGGYTGFNIRLTPFIKFGKNLIAVRVNNIWKPNIAPRAGEHVFSGGIYRNVRLVKKNPVHIEWYGTFVTTPTLAQNNGHSSNVHIQTEIKNNTMQGGTYKLKIQIKDENKEIITTKEATQYIDANSTAFFKLTTNELENIALWHPSHPHLYSLNCSLYKGNKLLDQDNVIFGFRWFKWTKDKGFFLNGKHFYFHGVNIHQDQAGWGDAVTEEAMRRDIHMMKEAGFDMIRGSHYPHAPAFSAACDSEGMLLWSEAPFWGTAGPKTDGYWTASAYPINDSDTAAFEKNILMQLEEMIRIHRNHPSVFVWSMCNEPFFTEEKTIQNVKRLLKKMVNKTHELDPTRHAALGGVQRPLGENRIDLIGDVAGYNGDGATISEFQSPNIPNVVTEYGSTTADRPGKFMPGWGDLGRNDAWKGHDWRSGQAIWCGFDHGSLFGHQMGKMGIVDYFRLPKRSWYWYRQKYNHIAPPVWPKEGIPAKLKIEASKITDIKANGTDDVLLTVTVTDSLDTPLSNSPKIQLNILNGPGQFPTGRSITFSSNSDIRIQEGKAAICLRAYYSGRTIIEATSPGLKAAQIELYFTEAPAYTPKTAISVIHKPYKRFSRDEYPQSLQVYGPNSPTFASSSASGHPSGLATDNDMTSFWQPEKYDYTPYLTLDIERTLNIHDVTIHFVDNSVNSLVTEISEDNTHWTKIAIENCKNKNSWQKTLDKPLKARFVRFTFKDNHVKTPPTITEIKVQGTLFAN